MMGAMPLWLLLVWGSSLAMCSGAEYQQYIQSQFPPFSQNFNNFAKNYNNFQKSYLSAIDNQLKSGLFPSEAEKRDRVENRDLKDEKKDKPIAVISFKPPKRRPHKESAPPHMINPPQIPTTELPTMEPLQIQTSKPFIDTPVEVATTPEPVSLLTQQLPEFLPIKIPTIKPQMNSQIPQNMFLSPLLIPPAMQPPKPPNLLQPESSQPYTTPSGPPQVAMVASSEQYTLPDTHQTIPASPKPPPYTPSTSHLEPLGSSAPYAPPSPYLEPPKPLAPYAASIPFFDKSEINTVPVFPLLSAKTALSSSPLFKSLGLDDEGSSKSLRYRTRLPGSEGDSSSGIFAGNEPSRFSPPGRDRVVVSKIRSGGVIPEGYSPSRTSGGLSPATKPTFIFTQVHGRNLFDSDVKLAAPLRLSKESYSYVSPENVPVYVLYVIDR